MEANTLRAQIAKRYGETAASFGKTLTLTTNACCGPSTSSSSCCGTGSTDHFADDYSNLDGYVPGADLNLGCGLPTELAEIKEGQTVLDLGSGAGNDVFIARRIVGENGQVLGVDMTPEMIRLARKNADSLGYSNVRFFLGEIESLPIPDQSVDVVVSNCVLNLVPEKSAAFTEMYRVIRPGGHFSISDVVIDGVLPEEIRNSVELWAGCVSGALLRSDYLKGLEEAGFQNVHVRKEKPISLSEKAVFEVLGEKLGAEYFESGSHLTSITVFGQKPA